MTQQYEAELAAFAAEYETEFSGFTDQLMSIINGGYIPRSKLEKALEDEPTLRTVGFMPEKHNPNKIKIDPAASVEYGPEVFRNQLRRELREKVL